MVLELLDRTRPTSKRTPEATTFPPVEYFDRAHSSSDGSTRFPQHLFSAHDHGRLRSNFVAEPRFTWPIRGPDCTLRGVHTRPVTQSMATPARIFLVHTLDRAGARQERPWIRDHTWEPTVLSRMSVPLRLLNVDRFHQPCMLPWRTPLQPPITAGCWAGIGKDCRPRTTWRPFTLAGKPCLPLRVSASKRRGTSPRRPDGATARR